MNYNLNNAGATNTVKGSRKKTKRLCLTMSPDDYQLVCEELGRENIADILVQLVKAGIPPAETVENLRSTEARRQRTLHIASLNQRVCSLAERAARALPADDNLVFQAAMIDINMELGEIL